MDKNTKGRPADYYEGRLKFFLSRLKKLEQKRNVLGLLRLGNILVIGLAFYFLYSVGWIYIITSIFILSTIFIILIYNDLKNKENIAHTRRLINIQESEIAAGSGTYTQYYDGENEKVKNHPYADDLDILGKSSLYQFMNRCAIQQGEKKLANWLLYPATAKDIEMKQKAVEFLKSNMDWVQEWMAIGKAERVSLMMQKNLEMWMEEKFSFRKFKAWRWLRYTLPVVIITISVLTIYDITSLTFFYFSAFIFLVFAYQINKVVAPIHNRLSQTANPMLVISKLAVQLELLETQDPLLSRLKPELKDGDLQASRAIKQLGRILDRLDYRYNLILTLPLNIFLSWSLQQVLDLEKWKETHKTDISKWIESFAIIDGLNSLAILAFNHPQWAIPKIQPGHFTLTGSSIGHPLIPNYKVVLNDINILNNETVMLVTGSNMGGKSTYLRSIGTNTVLALMGAVVYATDFSISPVQLISSMRVVDNLEESTSTFYAELKKLKIIIDLVEENAPVFILLDEILRGTNSLDRHAGSVALVKKFISKKAVAILATHDVELARIEDRYPEHIRNYHFDVQVLGEELFFDYKLKPGICTSMNASILMKKIGLNSED